jgi:hypothetical protein
VVRPVLNRYIGVYSPPCRSIFWQTTPWTVVLSKVGDGYTQFKNLNMQCTRVPKRHDHAPAQFGEAANYAPLYIEDRAMTRPTAYKLEEGEDGQVRDFTYPINISCALYP